MQQMGRQDTGPCRFARRPGCTGCRGALSWQVMVSDVTQLLKAIELGDAQASELLLPLVYEELRQLAARKMAREAPDHTLQPTALVHEAYVRLVGPGGDQQHW